MTYTTDFLQWLIGHYTDRLMEEIRPEAKAYLRQQLLNFKNLQYELD